MTVLLDTSILIPYLGSVAYDRFVWTRLIREQVYVSSVSGIELLAASLSPDQRQKADAFLDLLAQRERIVTPSWEEWLRAGRILARYQNRFGRLDPADHVNDILILLCAERLHSRLATENGEHFQIWSRFRPATTRPPLDILERQAHLNEKQPR